jgi:MarR family transcriptional regulator, 2-MHQ and catechol-resistance regulon repressor
MTGHRDLPQAARTWTGPSRSKASRTPGSRADAGPDPDGSANEVIVGIVRAGEAFVALANQALNGYQLSPAARQALAVLDGAGQPLSPTEIARRLIVTTASITSLLDTLQRRGLAERRPDPADRRRLLITITPAAQDLVRRFVPEIVALQASVMRDIREEDRRQFAAVLTRIREAIAAASP